MVMKSAEDVAKGIAYDIALCWCKDQHQQCDKADEIVPLIAQALTAFADDQNKYLTETLRLELLMEKEIKSRARDEALEQAASIVERNITDDVAWLAETVKRIRALKEKP